MSSLKCRAACAVHLWPRPAPTAVRDIFDGQRKTAALLEVAGHTSGRDLFCDSRQTPRLRRRPKLDAIVRVAPSSQPSPPTRLGEKEPRIQALRRFKPSPSSLLGGEGWERGRRRGLRFAVRIVARR